MILAKYLIGDLCSFSKGASIPRDRMHEKEGFLYLHYGDLYAGHNLYVDVENPEKKLPRVDCSEKIRPDQFVDDGDIIYVLTSETVDDLGHAFCINNPNHKRIVAGTETTVMRVNRRDVVDPRYLNYILQTPLFLRKLRQYVTGMKVFRVHSRDISRIEVNLPPLDQQLKVIGLLDAIYFKLRLNSRINDHLLELANAMFDRSIEAGSCVIPLGKIIQLEDALRIPLNRQQREQRRGVYPYYGAASIMDYVNDYLFDGVRLLLGEDGTVSTDGGYPMLQYVWGKYWVNNHAHVIRSSSTYSLETIYLALRKTPIAPATTGAVQKKISQTNLKKLMVKMPTSFDDDKCSTIFAEMRSIIDETERLESLRDTLLPKLMSGEIDVSQGDLTQLNGHLFENSIRS